MLTWFRSVAAVIVGYLVFAVSSYTLFRVSGQAPHASASWPFMLTTIALGVLFAAAGGYIAGWLAGRKPLGHAIAMALVLAAGALSSLMATIGHGAIWSQVSALALMAPAAVVGGWLHARAN